MTLDFKQFISKERDRLNKELDHLAQEQGDIEEKMEKVRQELSAIEAYENVKEGKPAPLKKTRTKRSGIKTGLMKVIRPNPQGLSRADILEKMGVKGDKAAEQSVSNALALAKKKGEIIQVDGLYKEVRGA